MRTYVVYCEPCGYKRLVEDPLHVGLPQIQTSKVPGRIPVLDPETKKTTVFDHITPMPKYRCPSCGRAVTLRKSNIPKDKPNAPQQDPPA